jgi:small-conductance mechanosensitive channel
VSLILTWAARFAIGSLLFLIYVRRVSLLNVSSVKRQRIRSRRASLFLQCELWTKIVCALMSQVFNCIWLHVDLTATSTAHYAVLIYPRLALHLGRIGISCARKLAFTRRPDRAPPEKRNRNEKRVRLLTFNTYNGCFRRQRTLPKTTDGV